MSKEKASAVKIKEEVTVEIGEIDPILVHKKIGDMLPLLNKYKERGMQITGQNLQLVLHIKFEIPVELQNQIEEIIQIVKGVAL